MTHFSFPSFLLCV
uniref:Solute carrier family 41, member 3 n=1 Tax=Nothobranchius kadleci TaxID=1051664 RepID=A0A1A8E4W8_NOTKA